jgi:hypothetical protein
VGSHNPHLIFFRKDEDGQHTLQSTYTTRATLKAQEMITNKKGPFVTGGPVGDVCPHQAATHELRHDQCEVIGAVYRSQLADVGETMLYMGEELILRLVRCARDCSDLYKAERYLGRAGMIGQRTAPDDESEG